MPEGLDETSRVIEPTRYRSALSRALILDGGCEECIPARVTYDVRRITDEVPQFVVARTSNRVEKAQRKAKSRILRLARTPLFLECLTDSARNVDYAEPS